MAIQLRVCTCFLVISVVFSPSNGQVFEDRINLVLQSLKQRAESAPVLGKDIVQQGLPVTLTLEDVVSSLNDRPYNVSARCMNHTLLVFEEITKGQMWAIQAVLDAAGKLPSGVLEGNFHWPGAYDQCLKIVADIPIYNKTGSQIGVDHVFNGKYCSANVNLGAQSFVPGALSLTIGLCVPDSCSQTDVSILVKNVVGLIPSNNTKAYVTCTEETGALSTSAIVMICVLSVLGALLIGGTLYDVAIYQPQLQLCDETLPEVTTPPEVEVSPQDREDVLNAQEYTPLLHSKTDIKAVPRTMLGKMLLALSLSSNMEKLLSCPDRRQPGLLPAIHGIRFLSITWVMLGHSYFFCVTAFPKATLPRLLVSLSVYSNAHKILYVEEEPPQQPGKEGGSAEPKKEPSPTLKAVHGVRFLSMTWVMLGHSFAFAFTVYENPGIMLDVVGRFTFQAIINATVSVDSFFLLSGTLLAYLLLREMKEAGGVKNINWLLFYFHRFWRLTPAYMLVMFTNMTLFPYWGSGPFWYGNINDNCYTSWWTNLLYINNLVDPSKMCMGWSWFLANDMQFFVISPLFLVLLYKFQLIGLLVTGGTLLINIIVTAVLTKQNNYPPTSVIGGDFNQENWFKDVYMSPWCRIGPYMVGILLGFILYKTDRKVNMHWGFWILGWCLAAAINLSVVYGLYDLNNGQDMSSDVSALYSSLNRVAWAVGLSWVIFACVTGHGGFVNTLLSWSAIVPLSRLTYTAYLIHPIIMYTYYMNKRTMIYYTDYTMIYFFLGHLVVTYGFAFLISLAFEAPMMSLEKVVFPSRRRR